MGVKSKRWQLATLGIILGVATAQVMGCSDEPGGGTLAPSDGGIADRPAIAIDGGGEPTPTNGAITPEVAARFAVLVGSCSPKAKAEGILRELYDSDGPRHLRGIAVCAAAKNNGCAALAECAGQVHERTGENCLGRCDGDVVETCDDGVRSRDDCAVRGLICLTREDGKLPACSETGAEACVAGPNSTRCGADGHAHSCSFDNERDQRGPRCADLGLTCGSGGCKGAEACKGDIAPQTPLAFTGTSCDGAKVRSCVNGGIATFDCERHINGAICRSSDAGIAGAAQCALGTACETNTFGKRTCEGASVVICNRGRVDRIDCPRVHGLHGARRQSQGGVHTGQLVT